MSTAAMGIVISLVDIRNGRMKDTLLSYAREGEVALLETRTGLIAADRILCRDTYAEMFNSAGDYFAVHYSEIRDIRPATRAVQTSAVNASGDWVRAPERREHTGSAALLHFPGKAR